MLDNSVKEYLNDMGCVQLNPVWRNRDMVDIIGYHYECNTTWVLKEVRETLEAIFVIDDLKYTLSDYKEDSKTTKLIIYLNN